MSNIYAIKETTLTSLGDAIRSKQHLGETSVTSTIPFFSNPNYANATNMRSFTLSEKAHSLKIYLSTEYDYSTAYQIFYTTDKTYDTYKLPQLESSKWIQDLSQPLEVSGNYVAFYCRRLDTTHTHIIPFDVTIIAYGENGNVPGALTPLEMVDAISELKVPELSPIVLTGDCGYACSGAVAAQFIKNFPDLISTRNITKAENMFYKCSATNLPFDINLSDSAPVSLSNMFAYSDLREIPDITVRYGTYHGMERVFDNCLYLESLPYIHNAYPQDISDIFNYCVSLRYIPDDWIDDWNLDRMETYNYASCSSLFNSCYSLRKLPTFINKLTKTTATNTSYYLYYEMCSSCYSLDEMILPIMEVTMTSNGFRYTCRNCYRLKNLMFQTNEDGSPKVVNWKTQTIDLTSTMYVGYVSKYNKDGIISHNSGITKDKEVNDDATYQALKNDEDWFATHEDYCRYNKISALATINSLPDTSAYLASAGGTNTIKFYGKAGAKTDGGAINTLTEEEIAIATAKGWSVTM